ncbi:MAG: RimK-like ATPgrasp N-terminal domain-containing protein [Thiolinea sp.]
MPDYILLVDEIKSWKKNYPDYPVVAVRDYLTGNNWAGKRSLRIINLCRNLSYQSLGYYASLLAEARHQPVLPAISTLQDLTRKTLYGPVLDDLDEMVNKVLGKQAQNPDIARFEIVLHFGECEDKAMQSLARKLYEAFRAPLLRVEFRRNGRWRISRVRVGHVNELSHLQQDFFFKTLEQQFRKRWRPPSDAQPARYDMAILHNPEEALAPSDARALQLFIRAAAGLGIAAELITPKQFGQLLEYDALFIRETTALNHHTYRFARKAAAEGLVVIDDRIQSGAASTRFFSMNCSAPTRCRPRPV